MYSNQKLYLLFLKAFLAYIVQKNFIVFLSSIQYFHSNAY